MKCGKCTKPTNGVTLCKTCARTLRHACINIAAHYDDLETLRTKQTRYGGLPSRGSIGKELPLVIDGRFADPTGRGTRAIAATRTTITTWAKTLLTTHPELDPPHDTIHAACGWLEHHVPLITRQPWAADMLADLCAIEGRLSRLVDRPPDGWYAGICGAVIEPDRPHDHTTCACSCHLELGTPCDIPGGCGPERPTIDGVRCTRTLYVEPGDHTTRCRDCGTTHTVGDRRAQLVREAEQQLAGVRVLARIVTTLGATDASERRLESRINTWVWRNQLTPVTTQVVNGRPTAMYRIGDVLDLLAEQPEKKPRTKENSA